MPSVHAHAQLTQYVQNIMVASSGCRFSLVSPDRRPRHLTQQPQEPPMPRLPGKTSLPGGKHEKVRGMPQLVGLSTLGPRSTCQWTDPVCIRWFFSSTTFHIATARNSGPQCSSLLEKLQDVTSHQERFYPNQMEFLSSPFVRAGLAFSCARNEAFSCVRCCTFTFLPFCVCCRLSVHSRGPQGLLVTRSL